MSIGIKWGINRKTFKKMARMHSKSFDPPHKTDAPEKCLLGGDYWKHYPINDYNYQYNSWGLRGEDFERYVGQSVNICIGDSCTINFGGPVEHSWPYLLSRYFDVPTLNYGIDGLSFNDFGMMLDKAKAYFKIDKIFVLYNFFEHDEEPMNHVLVPVLNSYNIDKKINVLKKYAWIHGAYWQFDPPWMFFTQELSCLYEHFPEAHDYLKTVDVNFSDVDFDLLTKIDQLRFEYYKIAGPSWMSYEQFCKNVLIGAGDLKFFNHDIDKQIINEYLSGWFIPTVKKMLLTNRDGWHMSKLVNQKLADYFYQQSLRHQ